MITTDFLLYYLLIGLCVSLALSRFLVFIDDPITSKYLRRVGYWYENKCNV